MYQELIPAPVLCGPSGLGGHLSPLACPPSPNQPPPQLMEAPGPQISPARAQGEARKPCGHPPLAASHLPESPREDTGSSPQEGFCRHPRAPHSVSGAHVGWVPMESPLQRPQMGQLCAGDCSHCCGENGADEQEGGWRAGQECRACGFLEDPWHPWAGTGAPPAPVLPSRCPPGAAAPQAAQRPLEVPTSTCSATAWLPQRPRLPLQAPPPQRRPPRSTHPPRLLWTPPRPLCSPHACARAEVTAPGDPHPRPSLSSGSWPPASPPLVPHADAHKAFTACLGWGSPGLVLASHQGSRPPLCTQSHLPKCHVKLPVLPPFSWEPPSPADPRHRSHSPPGPRAEAGSP